MRQKYEAAAKQEAGDDFYGYAAAFAWHHEPGEELSQESLDDFVGSLLHDADASEPVSVYTRLRTEAVTSKKPLAENELRLSSRSASKAVDDAVEAARASGNIVSIYRPEIVFPGSNPTAGALVAVDMKHLEAVVLYGRRGPKPIRIDCTIDKMISYEWEEGFSKFEYPDMDIQEEPMTGDLLLNIGGISPYSSASAFEKKMDYTMHVTRSGTKLTVEAKSDSTFYAKAEIDGATGAVWGDNDGNNRPNKAATLKCTGK